MLYRLVLFLYDLVVRNDRALDPASSYRHLLGLHCNVDVAVVVVDDTAGDHTQLLLHLLLSLDVFASGSLSIASHYLFSLVDVVMSVRTLAAAPLHQNIDEDVAFSRSLQLAHPSIDH